MYPQGRFVPLLRCRAYRWEVVMRRARARQETVLHLEGSPHALAVTYGVLTSMTLGGLAVVLLDPGGLFARIPPEIHAALASTPALTVGVVIAFLFAVGAFNHGRRWRTARAVERFSNDPALARYLPPGTPTALRRRAATRPMLQVRVVEPPLSRKRPKPLYRVTERSNVVGRPPLSILYLRVFENQPRARTFVKGAWREFGYVHLLRSATAVDPAVSGRPGPTDAIVRLFLSNIGGAAPGASTRAVHRTGRGRGASTRSPDRRCACTTSTARTDRVADLPRHVLAGRRHEAAADGDRPRRARPVGLPAAQPRHGLRTAGGRRQRADRPGVLLPTRAATSRSSVSRSRRPRAGA